MSSIELRIATQKDVEAFYGGLPPFTMRGIVAADETGRIIGIGGTYMYQGNTIVFSDMKEGARKHKKAILRAAKMVMAMIKDKRVFAICNTEIESAPRFLEYLGFFLVDEKNNIYVKED